MEKKIKIKDGYNILFLIITNSIIGTERRKTVLNNC